MMYKVLLLGLLLSFHSVFAQEKVELVVIDSEISDALVGANVVVIETGEVYATDLEGKLVFDLIPGMSLSLSISVVGYDTQVIKISSSKNRVIVRMVPTLVDLDEVVVTTKAVDANVKSTNLGRNVLEIESIRELPPLAGEVDVIKSLVLLPGVSTVGEASSGFNVRGGGLDQNLILLGGGVLYNPSHLFGFFSSITPEVIDGVVLFKGVVPPKYGGRASSVLDIGLKTGDYKKWGGSLGVGFVSSKASLSGPIIEDKLALTLGGRVSYVNWLLNSFNSDEVQRSNANFNDISGKLDYFINDNNQLSYSFYNSTDDFNLASDTTNEWSNQSHVIKWDHFFSDRLSSTVTGSYNKYAFGILNESGINDFTLESSIIDQSVKLDLDYKLSDKYNINFGAEGRSYLIDPGTFELKNDVDAENLDIEDEQGVEVAAFLYNEVDIGEKLRISAGARYVDYRYLGEKTVSVYDDIFPKSNATRIDQISYGAGETITSFARLEPRFGVRYTINESTSVKAGYNRMNQFINLISNTASISPVNIWKLSDTHVNPQSSQQLSLGVFKNFNNNSIETSVEGYYKEIDDILEYKDGARLLLQENIETELVNGVGKAYGVELYVKKNKGLWTGWFSYTYSRSLRLVESAFLETSVNNGEWYASNFDKPHDLTFVLNRKTGVTSKFSAIFTYSSGRPVTFPQAKVRYFGQDLAYFDSRNESRIPDYHRLDVSYTFKVAKSPKLLAGDWTLSVYNIYARNNAYSVFFDDVPGRAPGAFQLSVLGTLLPSVSYFVEF